MTAPHTLVARDARAIAGNQKLRFFPVSVVSGQGSEVRDESGRTLLDLSAEWGAKSLGHAHPRVVAAIQQAAATGAGASVLSAVQPSTVELAELLIGTFPGAGRGDRRVLFGHSGTDANSAALAAARAATGRDAVVAFRGGYHGGFGAAQAVSGVFVEAGVPGDPASVLLPYPAQESDLPELWRTLEDVLRTLDVAAVIVEPVQSDGGVIVPPDGFLAGLSTRTRRAGAVLIVDEVKVGLARTGQLHAFQRSGIAPDLVTLGKALGGGTPLSAVVGSADLLDRSPASALLTTAGNGVSTAAGHAVLETILSDDLASVARDRGNHLRGLLATAQRDTGEIADVRGLGLSLGIELQQDPAHSDRQADDRFTHRVIYRMWQLGVVNYLVRGNVIEWTPPLILTEHEAERAVDTLRTAIVEVRHGAVSDADIAPYLGW